jgi:hypothetical protein
LITLGFFHSASTGAASEVIDMVLVLQRLNDFAPKEL